MAISEHLISKNVLGSMPPDPPSLCMIMHVLLNHHHGHIYLSKLATSGPMTWWSFPYILYGEQEGADPQKSWQWSYMEVALAILGHVPKRAPPCLPWLRNYCWTAGLLDCWTGLVDWHFHVIYALKWDLLTCRFCHDSCIPFREQVYDETLKHTALLNYLCTDLKSTDDM